MCVTWSVVVLGTNRPFLLPVRERERERERRERGREREGGREEIGRERRQREGKESEEIKGINRQTECTYM